MINVGSRVALAAALLCACAGDGTRSSTTATDSAGVQIVESSGDGAWATSTPWMVADTPSVSIGGNESDTTTLFSNIRNTVRLGDGRIAVTNYGTREIRFYDSTGRFVKAVGRMGQGPGEFDYLGRALRTEGDSLVLWDPNNARLSVVDPGGRVVREVPLRSGEGFRFPDPIARTSDGMLIGRVGVPVRGEGAIRSPLHYVRYGPDLRPIDTIAIRPGPERLFQRCGQGMCGYDAPFARTTSEAVYKDRLYVGNGDRYAIDVIGSDGRFVRSIRVATPSRPIGASDITRQHDAFLARARNPERRTELEQVWAAMPMPKTMPAFRDLRVDRVGNLWVEHYRVVDADPPRWTVFDSTGRLLGALATPRSFRIDEIGDDYLLGVFRDSLDVEHVRLHRITKPRPN